MIRDYYWYQISTC